MENILIKAKKDLKKTFMNDDNLKSNLDKEFRRRYSWEIDIKTKIMGNFLLISYIEYIPKIEDKNENSSYFHKQEEITEEVGPEFTPKEKSLCPNMKYPNKWPEKVIK